MRIQKFLWIQSITDTDWINYVSVFSQRVDKNESASQHKTKTPLLLKGKPTKISSEADRVSIYLACMPHAGALVEPLSEHTQRMPMTISFAESTQVSPSPQGFPAACSLTALLCEVHIALLMPDLEPCSLPLWQALLLLLPEEPSPLEHELCAHYFTAIKLLP